MRTHLMGGVLAAAALVATPLAACSDDDDTSATTTTTVTADGEPTSTTAGTAVSEDPLAGFTVVEHDEDGGTDGDRLLDGRHFGFLTALTDDGGELVGELDLAEYFSGEEARQARLEDDPDAVEELDFYVRNQNPQLRPIVVAPDAEVFDIEYGTDGCCSPVPKSAAQFAADLPTSSLEATPVDVTIEDGVVVRIVEVYFP